MTIDSITRVTTNSAPGAEIHQLGYSIYPLDNVAQLDLTLSFHKANTQIHKGPYDKGLAWLNERIAETSNTADRPFLEGKLQEIFAQPQPRVIARTPAREVTRTIVSSEHSVRL